MQRNVATVRLHLDAYNRVIAITQPDEPYGVGDGLASLRVIEVPAAAGFLPGSVYE